MNRIVVFDLDDTLFPEWQFVLSGFRAVDEFLIHSQKLNGFYAEAERLFKSGARGNIFDLAFNALGIPLEKSLVNELVRVYREHKPKLNLHEDARWALNYFSARAPIGLISDGYLVTQQNKLGALNVAEAFTAIVFSDALGRDCWKPSPEPYRRVMQLIPGGPAEYVYIADNPKKDFVTARNLGWNTVQIERKDGTYHGVQPEPGYEANLKIQSLHELENL